MAATEQQTRHATKRLKQWIDLDKQVVTYRQLARELSCNVNVAKNILSDHLRTNSSLYATYHLTGLLLPPGSQFANAQASNSHFAKNGGASAGNHRADDAMDVDEDDYDEPVKAVQKGWVSKAVQESEVRPETVPRFGIILAGAESVESQKRLFFPDSLRVHVYSLAFGKVNDPAMYLTPSSTLRSHASYYDPTTYGTITGTAFGATAPVPPMPTKAALPVASSSKATSSKAPVQETKPAKAQIKTEETVTANASNAVKKEGPASAMYTNSTGSKPPSAATSGNKSGADPKLKGGFKGKAVRRIDSDEDEPEEERPQPVPAKGSAKAKQVPKTESADNEDMMRAMMDMPIDIDDDDAEADAESALPSNQAALKSQKKPVKKRPSSAQAKDASMSGDDEDGPVDAARPRKRRRVTKSKTYLDDKGYMVEANVSVSESYSSSEEPEVQAKSKPKPKPRKSDPAATTSVDAKSKPKPKPQTAPPPAKKGGKPGQQSSLKGFFTKKT